MKLLLTILLAGVSTVVLAHTGDHDGIWHGHGIIAQTFILLSALLGYSALANATRHAKACKNKDSDDHF